jgi:hypothetical protein
VNFYNQIVGQAGALSCGDVLKDRLYSVHTFSEISTEIAAFVFRIIIQKILGIYCNTE